MTSTNHKMYPFSPVQPASQHPQRHACQAGPARGIFYLLNRQAMCYTLAMTNESTAERAMSNGLCNVRHFLGKIAFQFGFVVFVVNRSGRNSALQVIAAHHVMSSFRFYRFFHTALGFGERTGRNHKLTTNAQSIDAHRVTAKSFLPDLEFFPEPLDA